ncbi:MAG TPA: hypothetical protein VF668_23850 [Pyrinomonadaceae bacterium]|jgi:hypothetical protein
MRTVYGPRARRGRVNLFGLGDFGRAARRGVALFAAAAMLNLAWASAAARARTAAAASGQVISAEGLTLDGSPAVSGQTFFSGSVFDAPAGASASASLALGNLARVGLSGGARLRLDFTDSTLRGALEAGAARVYAPAGVVAALATADASVLSDAAAGPAVFGVTVSKEGTTLNVQAGRVEMRAGGRARTAVAGETLRASAGSAPEPPAPQGQNLSGGRKAGLFVGVAAALVAVILVVTGREDKVEDSFGGCPIVLSPTGGPLPPCF